MKLRRDEVPARSYVGRRDPSAVPAKTSHKTIRLIISIAAILIVALLVLSGGNALAQSATTVLRKTSPDTGPYDLRARSGPAIWRTGILDRGGDGDRKRW